MTFLELCQAVARESGTISGTKPTTVVGQTGRLLNVVSWTAEAYRMIQRERRDWRWLDAEFSGNTVAAQGDYTPANMGITSRFVGWRLGPDHAKNSLSAYLTSTGRADEQWMVFYDWERFEPVYRFGADATRAGRPVAFSVTPDNKIALWPIPDAVYTLRGRYRKGVQNLTADSDVPEMPDENHYAIVWRALMLLGTFDEAAPQMPAWQTFYAEQMKNLRNAQLPRISLGGPLA
jgi:hypothetical protein